MSDAQALINDLNVRRWWMHPMMQAVQGSITRSKLSKN